MAYRKNNDDERGCRQAKIKPLSVNQAWQGRRYKSKDYKAYKEQLMVLLPQFKLPKAKKLAIYIELHMSNARADWDNPIKPFVDVLQDRYGFDDSRIYSGTIVKKIVGKGQECILWDIKEYKEVWYKKWLDLFCIN